MTGFASNARSRQEHYAGKDTVASRCERGRVRRETPGCISYPGGDQAREVATRTCTEMTIDGVQMLANVTPSNPSDLNSWYNSGDLGMDLIMISASMLSVIEVTKAITPDMVAAVLGEVVNFILREAQTVKPQSHLQAQGGYDNLKGIYDEHIFAGTAEERFFDSGFGIFAEVDVERQSLSANDPGANFNIKTKNFRQPNRTCLFGVTLTDQPDKITNIEIGYDLGGFSARVSMLYKSKIFGAANFWPELRSNTAQYLRWDASAKQNLPWYRLQAYLDLYSLNETRDIQINQGANYPTAEDFSGMTADLRLRLRLQTASGADRSILLRGRPQGSIHRNRRLSKQVSVIWIELIWMRRR